VIIIEQFFQFLAPHDCISCGKEGRLLCQNCAGALESLPESCYRCHSPSTNSKTCQLCIQHSSLKYVWVRTPYTDAAKKVIHSLKFIHARDAAELIAEEMAGVLPRLKPDVMIVHVTAASSRVRLRGFDQSALIARELARLKGLRHMHVLGRTGQQRQVGASRDIRSTQMEDAFRPLSPAVIKDARIILVDDVLTTGSTLEAAAKVLRDAGAKVVGAVVFAQSP
jgi:ComF family protein